MSTALQNLLSDAKFEKQTGLWHVFPVPNDPEALDLLHRVLIACGYYWQDSDRVTAIQIDRDRVLINVNVFFHNWSARIPLDIFHADDPVREAKLWCAKQKVHHAMTDLRQAQDTVRSRTEYLEKVLAEYNERLEEGPTT